MIFYSANQRKILLLFFLVAAATGVIIWQWANFAPWTKVAQQTNPQWQAAKQEAEDLIDDIGESLKDGQQAAKNLGDEVADETERQKLLQLTADYVAGQNTTTADVHNTSTINYNQATSTE